MEKILLIDMVSLFPLLFWGNAVSVLVLFIYYLKDRLSKDRRILLCLLACRLCHAFYYFVATGRGILPDWLSVNTGNTLLLCGFFFEAQAILRLIKENTRFTDRFLQVTLACVVLLFNVVEWFAPLGGPRITTASVGTVALMVLPVARMLLSHGAGTFARVTAMFYSVFLFLLLGRAWYGLENLTATVLTTNLLQSVSFLALLLQLMVALPAYVLIMKDYADEALVLMATTDHVTGATNRHAFLNAATAVFANSKQLQISLAVLFIDIDQFKGINDKYGHAFGDSVLARLTALVDKALRSSDLSCRYGGDEFVVLLPRSDRTAAKMVVQRIMKEVRAARFEQNPDYELTISIGGYCGTPQPGQTFDDIIAAADKAMYRAKRAGRNRAFLSGSKPDK